MKVPRIKRTMGDTSLKVLAGDITRWADEMFAMLSGKVELPTVDITGRKQPGNLSTEMVIAEFTADSKDTFVAHDLGVPTRDWCVFGSGGFIAIKDGSKPPSVSGLWLQSYKLTGEYPVKVRILVSGRSR